MKKVIIIDVKKKKEKELEDKYNRHILQDRYKFDEFYQKNIQIYQIHVQNQN